MRHPIHTCRPYHDATLSCEEAGVMVMYAREHDFHLDLQEQMRHPIAFHVEMMGNIMYYHQVLQQHNAAEK